MSGKKRRFWSEDEKRLICEQPRAPGVSVAQVARRYALNANMIFKWLRDPHLAPEVTEAEVENVLLPVEVPELGIVASPRSIDLPASPCPAAPASGVLARRVEITLSDGRRVLVEGPTELEAVVTLVKGLIS